MPRWLSSMLIVIGFLALVGMAMLPKSVTVTVQIDGSTSQAAPEAPGTGVSAERDD